MDYLKLWFVYKIPIFIMKVQLITDWTMSMPKRQTLKMKKTIWEDAKKAFEEEIRRKK